MQLSPLAICHTSYLWSIVGYCSLMYFCTDACRSVTRRCTLTLASESLAIARFSPSSSIALELVTSLLWKQKLLQWNCLLTCLQWTLLKLLWAYIICEIKNLHPMQLVNILVKNPLYQNKICLLTTKSTWSSPTQNFIPFPPSNLSNPSPRHTDASIYQDIRRALMIEVLKTVLVKAGVITKLCLNKYSLQNLL